MKKFKCVSIIILLFIIIYFFQINIFTWFNIAGIMPNLFIVLVLFIGLFIGKKLGLIFGLSFGIILDMLLGKNIGFNGILLGMVGLLGEYFDKNFSKDSRIMIIIISVISTAFFEIGMYAINIIKYNSGIEVFQFLYILLVENIFNILIISILYPGIKKLGYYLEENYKGRKLLTRYY